MQKLNRKTRFPKSLIIMAMLTLILPTFSLANHEGITAPQTLGEAKNFSIGILSKLPEAVKRVWKEEALPVWQKMWEWAKPVIDPWRQRFLGLLGREVEKRRPDIEKQFQEEKEEMQNDLWERFKNLIGEAI